MAGTEFPPWGPAKWPPFLQPILSYQLACMEMVAFWFIIHQNMFARVKLTIRRHWLKKIIGVEQATVHYLNKSGIILCIRPANESRRYIVTSSPIGWAHTQNDPCKWWSSYIHHICVTRLGIDELSSDVAVGCFRIITQPYSKIHEIGHTGQIVL